MYIHFEGVIDRMKARVKENPALALKEPHMALLQKKYDYFVGLSEEEHIAEMEEIRHN